MQLRLRERFCVLGQYAYLRLPGLMGILFSRSDPEGTEKGRKLQRRFVRRKAATREELLLNLKNTDLLPAPRMNDSGREFAGWQQGSHFARGEPGWSERSEGCIFKWCTGAERVFLQGKIAGSRGRAVAQVREQHRVLGMCAPQRTRQSDLALHSDDKDEKLRTDCHMNPSGHTLQAICFSPALAPGGVLAAQECSQAFK